MAATSSSRTANARSILSITPGALRASFSSFTCATLVALASAAAAAASSGFTAAAAAAAGLPPRPTSAAASFTAPAMPPVATALGLKSRGERAPPVTMRVFITPPSTRATYVGCNASANALLWVTATTAPFHPRSASVRASIAAVSRWLDASSSSSTFTGRNTKAANATRAFSPPLSSPMRRSLAALPESPSAPSTARAVCSVTVGLAARATCNTWTSGVASSGSSCARS
mmetsp:Transcript_29826/g.74611  ORF Transcript_29826/g.74611 Transcript_29826/m.74611 type:complete len:230 (-) Transcript_29826:553-1242(-)